MKIVKRLQHLFYLGPTDLGIRVPRRNGYQSPTLTLGLWLYALVVRHFTLAGRLLLLCLAVIFPYGMVSMLMPVHLLSFGMLLLYLVNIIAGYFWRPQVKLRRQMPERVGANAKFKIDYAVTARGSRIAYDTVLDTLPLPRPLRFIGGRAIIRELAPGETATARAEAQAGRRGRYLLSAPRADSGFPFYLWRWGTTTGTPQPLVVYPAFTPLRRLDLPVAKRYQPGGIALTSTVGDSMEFLGCREFRDGDNPRHLHWRSWARRGEPVVKEFREEYMCRTALVLDTLRPGKLAHWRRWLRRPDPVFEAGLSFGAAAADYLSRQDYIVELFAAGPAVYRFQGGRSLGLLDNILDILACLEAQPADPFPELLPALRAELPQMSGVLIVLLDWNEERRRCIEELRRDNLQLRVILVQDGREPPPGLPGDIAVLAAADIAAGHCDAV